MCIYAIEIYGISVKRFAHCNGSLTILRSICLSFRALYLFSFGFSQKLFFYS